MSNRALKTYVFFCSSHPESDQWARCCHGLEGGTVKTIGLPCSGKVDVPYLVKAFETGADGVVILTCRKSECRHLEGSLRAHKRAEAVESLLEEIGMGMGRMAVIESGERGQGQVLGEIQDFIARVKHLPPLPARSGAANEQEKTVA